LVERHGAPLIQNGDRAGKSCGPIILALGKLGGREPNYHSDLDLVFLYEADGMTRPRRNHRRPDPTTNQHFFSQWGQRIIKGATHLGPSGRLYEVDSRLRPTGRSGALALSLDELGNYFATGQGRLGERQALCKARPIFGPPDACQRALEVVHQCMVEPAWKAENAREIRSKRTTLEANASPRNLKRGPGGTMDIEFVVQMLQLRHAHRYPQILTPGTLDAIEALAAADCLQRDDADYFAKSYRFLRSIESGIRLMNTTARHDLPENEAELKKLAYLLGYENERVLREDCWAYTNENRIRFIRIFEEAGNSAIRAGS